MLPVTHQENSPQTPSEVFSTFFFLIYSIDSFLISTRISSLIFFLKFSQGSSRNFFRASSRFSHMNFSSSFSRNSVMWTSMDPLLNFTRNYFRNSLGVSLKTFEYSEFLQEFPQTFLQERRHCFKDFFINYCSGFSKNNQRFQKLAEVSVKSTRFVQ